MIGIRREDKNPWERRAPLTPDHVEELVRDRGIPFRVQPSTLRAFADKDYAAAGAEVDEDLSPCRVILGVKEVPPGKILAGRTYVFFPHVTKGQRHNMAMLHRILEARCTLLDYEQITDDQGRRLIFFGRHAGYAGMIDALWALGRRLLAEGHSTPFAEVRRALEYSGLDEATHHLTRLGERLRHVGVPPALRPIVVGLTGSGNVTRGALEILDRLPTQDLTPEELAPALQDEDRPRNLVYTVRFQRRHRFARIEGGGFDEAEFAEHPERYRGNLGTYAPHLTVLVHGAFWAPPQPSLLSLEDLRRLWNAGGTPKLRVIADLSCDLQGGIECTVRIGTPGDPVYVYDPITGEVIPGVAGRGPVVLAVDNLPCELPVEASQHFGDSLVRFVPPLHRCDWDAAFDALALPPELHRAIIAHQGQLTPRFRFIGRWLAEAGFVPSDQESAP